MPPLPSETDPWLNTAGVSRETGKSARTIERYRETGEGPAYHKLGRSVLYRLSDVQSWISAQRRTSTSEAA